MHLTHLLRQSTFAQIARLVRGKLAIKLCCTCIRENRRQLIGQLLLVAKQLVGLHPDRIAINTAGQRHAVPIDDVATVRNIVGVRRTIGARAFKKRKCRQSPDQQKNEKSERRQQNKQAPKSECRERRSTYPVFACCRSGCQYGHRPLRSRSALAAISRIRSSESSFSSIRASRSVRLCSTLGA